MNLLLIIDDYIPSSTRVSAKMMHELASEFKTLGHEVTILTPGNKYQSEPLEKTKIDTVHVWYFRSGSIKDISRIERLTNESLLSWLAWKAIQFEVKKLSIDGIVYYSPSIFFGSLVKNIKRNCNCPAYLILRDLFPQWVIDQGIIHKYSPITFYLRFFERNSYYAADRIGLMSKKNIEVFKKLQPKLNNLEVLHNWTKTPDSYRGESFWRNKLGLKDKIILLYGGNIGKAQDMPNLMRLTVALKNEVSAHFLIVGQGECYQDVADFIQVNQLQNTTLIPSIPQSDFQKLLTEVDIGLFSLAATHTAHNFPGKVLGYIANQLPILGSVNPGNDLMPIINDHQAGFVFENGNDIALINATKKLIHDTTLRQIYGENASKLLERYFSVKSACNKILKTFNR